MPATQRDALYRGELGRWVPWLGLATSLAAVFMQLLDATIVNVALPSIAVDLGASVSAQLLMVSVYTLSFACSLITAARLGDLLGRRRVFLTALAVFVTASLLCGLAQSPTALVASRALQGLAAGSMSAQTFAIISGLFPKRSHPRVFGIYGATIGLATICGPLVGGLLIQWDLFGWGWRLIFFVNLPLGLAALVLGYFYLVDAKPDVVHGGGTGRREARSLDMGGAVLSALGLFLLIFPLAEGRERGWPTTIVVMLLCSVPVLIAFVVYEWRLGRRGGDPVLRLQLFTDRAFSLGAAIAFVFFGTLTSLIFTISLTLQFGFGFSPLRAGVMTLPWALGTGLAALASAVVYRRIGNLVLPLGMALFAGSLVVLSAQLLHEGTDPRWSALAGPLFVGGAGLGLFVAPLQTAILATVQPQNAGSVSGLLPTVQQVGSSIGLAVIGVVFFNLVATQSADAVQAERPALTAELAAVGVPPGLIPRAEETFVRCATEQLGSTSPMKVPDECRSLGSGGASLGAAQQQIADSDVVAARESTRSAAGEAFLQAERRILWIIAAVAAAIGVASLTLPRRNQPADDVSVGVA
ncbi:MULTISPECIES: MFS transporter [unclassified Rhodococcus (in: high G+C Gram-positive bacteria)]|uniref:MFS transporter n=1 Tax=unclassified Rhodococcus (in: high G+C Gram-positive bacteria) TaxID=192944 RepID=UPI001639B3E1|nr:MULTISPECIES: MFS transporter [unclassified Rhodococcus (in: high G+C Gram-positive bacteria)]MBC2643499.1 MFS transporter [Rhodococcus sp. 3A]MBC2891761.1 MFS transporter [Rhodococcus sp. 4CII]